jgi:hypothetical protein
MRLRAFNKFVFILIVIPYVYFSQKIVLEGSTFDKKNESVPFVHLRLMPLNVITTSNHEGRFKIILPPGQYTLECILIGYKTKKIPLSLSENKVLDIVMEEQDVQLTEVTVKATDNPGRTIMKKAIKKRKFHKELTSFYSAETYIKGLQQLNEFSKKLVRFMEKINKEKIDSNLLKGILYLSESKGIYFRNGSERKEIMLASKVSGNSKAFSINRYSYMDYDFYDPLVELYDISEKKFISPLNPGALVYYKFKLEGSYCDRGVEVNKIKVIPRNEREPVFQGYVYIQENSWRIHALDLFITKKSGVQFVDTVYIKQDYISVSDSVWLPSQTHVSFNYDILGFKGNGFFHAFLKNHRVGKDLIPDSMKNVSFKVVKSAREKDSSYWNKAREIPLTEKEQRDYVKKDSIEQIRQSPRYLDSVDKVANRYGAGDFLFGYSHQNTRKKTYWNMPGLLDAGIQYNTVEGINLSNSMRFFREYEDKRTLALYGAFRYGFSNRLPGAEFLTEYLYNPKKFSSFFINVHSIQRQYNNQNPIEELVNTIYTLFLNRNYMKTYRESGTVAGWSSEVFRGLTLEPNVKYEYREPLRNTTDLLIRDVSDLLFTSNDPLNPETDDKLFKPNHLLQTELNIRIRFRQQYAEMEDVKIKARSPYPKWNLKIRRAWRILENSPDFWFGSSELYDNVQLGVLGELAWRLHAGYFYNVKKINYMDYGHFMGNQTIIQQKRGTRSFRLLEYYSVSTKEYFAEAHLEHDFQGFLLKKIPLLRFLPVSELAGFHVLNNNRTDYYLEWNAGVKVFGVRVDFVMGRMEQEMQWRKGFTVGFSREF